MAAQVRDDISLIRHDGRITNPKFVLSLDETRPGPVRW